jgi:hypothetical protein
VIQTNFDSQWISSQAKDGINSTGAGAFWNVLNLSQMLLRTITGTTPSPAPPRDATKLGQPARRPDAVISS